jgi:hypothetical protein
VGIKKKSTGTLNNQAEALLLTNPDAFQKRLLFSLKIAATLSVCKVQNQQARFQIFLALYPGFFSTRLYPIGFKVKG